jgi:alginate O-acetyltransferase complex protein AlgI
MVFASLTFLYFFLPINLILYYSLKNNHYRNVLLTVMSLVFYAWGEPIWICLLIFSALIDYWNGLWVEKARGTKYAKLPVLSTLVVNLGLLISFKYSGFITENVNFLLGTHFIVPSIALPIGISFYSFQTISYVIDVYRDEVKAQRSFMNFLLFVSLYHQLVAGPIVRYAHIASEIDERTVLRKDLSDGILRFCIGLFKKVCIANVAGELVGKLLVDDFSQMGFADAWFGIVLFSIQIYFDFSGYSDMAIGLGRMVGFHYHENFKYPYLAQSASDFWRRWHISLGTFFKDYIYIPLGGNKHRMYWNLLIVWFLTGLWHGASWNFIFWGMYWGVLILLEKAFLDKVLQRIPKFLGHIYLIFAAVIGWAFFFFEDLSKLWGFFSVLFGQSHHLWATLKCTALFNENIFWFLFALLLCFPVFHWIKTFFEKYKESKMQWVKNSAVIVTSMALLFLSTAMLVGKTFNPFLYFRF